MAGCDRKVPGWTRCKMTQILDFSLQMWYKRIRQLQDLQACRQGERRNSACTFKCQVEWCEGRFCQGKEVRLDESS
jgi:hypothetical protein